VAEIGVIAWPIAKPLVRTDSLPARVPRPDSMVAKPGGEILVGRDPIEVVGQRRDRRSASPPCREPPYCRYARSPDPPDPRRPGADQSIPRPA